MPSEPTGTTALSVRGLSFGYGGRPVLRELSFDVTAGRLTVLLGRNGSGKSTLLRLLAGVLGGAAGTIEVHGQRLDALDGAARARLLGYLPQFHRAVFPFTVEDVVLTGRAGFVRVLPGERDRQQAREAIRTVGIEALRDRPYTELSGGERQLVLIARVLAQQPRVLLLDEPIAHLDLVNQVRLMALVKRLTASGLTVVAVLHDPNTALLHGNDYLFLMRGRPIVRCDGDTPWSAALLSEVFGLETELVHAGPHTFLVPATDGAVAR